MFSSGNYSTRPLSPSILQHELQQQQQQQQWEQGQRAVYSARSTSALRSMIRQSMQPFDFPDTGFRLPPPQAPSRLSSSSCSRPTTPVYQESCAHSFGDSRSSLHPITRSNSFNNNNNNNSHDQINELIIHVINKLIDSEEMLSLSSLKAAVCDKLSNQLHMLSPFMHNFEEFVKTNIRDGKIIGAVELCLISPSMSFRPSQASGSVDSPFNLNISASSEYPMFLSANDQPVEFDTSYNSTSELCQINSFFNDNKRKYKNGYRESADSEEESNRTLNISNNHSCMDAWSKETLVEDKPLDKKRMDEVESLTCEMSVLSIGGDTQQLQNETEHKEMNQRLQQNVEMRQSTVSEPSRQANTIASGANKQPSHNADELACKEEAINFTDKEKKSLLGWEYIKKKYASNGLLYSFYCHLCECNMFDMTFFVLQRHTRGKKHSQFYNQRLLEAKGARFTESSATATSTIVQNEPHSPTPQPPQMITPPVFNYNTQLPFTPTHSPVHCAQQRSSSPPYPVSKPVFNYEKKETPQSPTPKSSPAAAVTAITTKTVKLAHSPIPILKVPKVQLEKRLYYLNKIKDHLLRAPKHQLCQYMLDHFYASDGPLAVIDDEERPSKYEDCFEWSSQCRDYYDIVWGQGFKQIHLLTFLLYNVFTKNDGLPIRFDQLTILLKEVMNEKFERVYPEDEPEAIWSVEFGASRTKALYWGLVKELSREEDGTILVSLHPLLAHLSWAHFQEGTLGARFLNCFAHQDSHHIATILSLIKCTEEELFNIIANNSEVFYQCPEFPNQVYIDRRSSTLPFIF